MSVSGVSSASALQSFDIIAIIAASLTLITTASWNTLLQNVMNYYFPEHDKNITAQTLYTIILTFCVGILLYYITRYGGAVKDYINSVATKIK